MRIISVLVLQVISIYSYSQQADILIGEWKYKKGSSEWTDDNGNKIKEEPAYHIVDHMNLKKGGSIEYDELDIDEFNKSQKIRYINTNSKWKTSDSKLQILYFDESTGTFKTKIALKIVRITNSKLIVELADPDNSEKVNSSEASIPSGVYQLSSLKLIYTKE